MIQPYHALPYACRTQNSTTLILTGPCSILLNSQELQYENKLNTPRMDNKNVFQVHKEMLFSCKEI